MDVGGGDARSKLKILIKLAFGVNVPEDDIPCAGITEIKSIDFAYARLMKVPHISAALSSCKPTHMIQTREPTESERETTT